MTKTSRSMGNNMFYSFAALFITFSRVSSPLVPCDLFVKLLSSLRHYFRGFNQGTQCKLEIGISGEEHEIRRIVKVSGEGNNGIWHSGSGS